MIWRQTFPGHPVYMQNEPYGECQSDASDEDNETLCCTNEGLKAIVGDQTHVEGFLGGGSHNQSISVQCIICRCTAVSKKPTGNSREDKTCDSKRRTLDSEKNLMGNTGE